METKYKKNKAKKTAKKQTIANKKEFEKLNKKPKKKLIEDAVTIQEIREETRQIKRIEANIRPGAKGTKSTLRRMWESGEDKVIAQKIFILASKGYARKKIRNTLDIKLSMWNNMINKDKDEYPIYRTALYRGEDYAIEQIEEAMKKSALGYDVEEKEIVTDNITGMIIKTKITTKHFKPDVKAGMFMLTNKKPDEYKMKRTEEININIKKEEVDYTKLPPEVLKMLIEAKTTNEMDKIIHDSGPIVDTVKKDES